MKKQLRHVLITLLGAYVIVLSVIISFGFMYMANEFKDEVSRDNACKNTLALLLFIIFFVKYVFWKEKRRWLHYYLVAYAAFVGIFLEITQKSLHDIVRHGFKYVVKDLPGTLHGMSLVIVPLAFSMILLFDEIKHAVSNRTRR